MKLSSMRFRRWFIAGVTVAVLVVLIARLMNIQIVHAQEYLQDIDSSYISKQILPATRGEIVDRNGVPLASNRVGFDVIIDKAFFPPNKESAQQNKVILDLIKLSQQMGESWNDKLPLTLNSPFEYTKNADADIAKLKKFAGTMEYATADDVFFWLVKKYKLESFSDTDARRVAGVRYEMEQRDFALNVPYTFAQDISKQSVIKIRENSYRLDGVDVIETAIRSYENGDVAPHVIGTVGLIYLEEYKALAQKGYSMNDKVGKSGIEASFESILRGKNGLREIAIDANGKVLTATQTTPPTPGDTIALTLDSKLQKVAQGALADQIKKLQLTAETGEGKEANAGSVVALDIKTGQILVMETYPSYDQNNYRKDYDILRADVKNAPLLNRAVYGEYAPGSIFKPVVGLAGLFGGVIDDTSIVNCGHVYEYLGHTFTCLGTHGGVNINSALRVSCNIFFYDVGKRVGIESIADVAGQMGLGQPTGIEIPEYIGRVSTPEVKMQLTGEQWYPGDVLQSSIGQLYHQFTPLQYANYAATIANRGKRMKVTIVKEVRDYFTKSVKNPFSPVVAQLSPIPASEFETVIEGMVSASRIGTAATHFGNYPVDVASKTGTPETAKLPNSTFICFAPANDPQIAIAVVIERGWHGYTGAPVAKVIMDSYFGYPITQILTPEQKQIDITADSGIIYGDNAQQTAG